jgi:hypothetical protein
MDNYSKLINEINQIKQLLLSVERNTSQMGDWLPKKVVMRFFDYGETQLRTLETSGEIVVSKIGRRKFYSKKSILKLLKNNNLINDFLLKN